jgi:hypothetical protein
MTAEIWLWLDSIIRTDAAGATSMMEFMLNARAWAVDHAGDMSGFSNKWWKGLMLPFVCYSRPDMERRAVTFSSEAGVIPSFRQFNYAMNVSLISANGLRFKVYDAPELWVLAAHTQGGMF